MGSNSRVNPPAMTAPVASLPAKMTRLVTRLRDGDWNMRAPEELAECVADAIMEAIATTEQPGSSVQGEAVATVMRGTKRAHVVWHGREEETVADGAKLYTTPPPAPAAEQGEFPECSGDPASCPENEGYGCCKRNDGSQWQPEARGVEGVVAWLRESAAACGASEYGEGCRDAMTETADKLEAATPNPVRAEQPEGKGADRMAIRLLVAAGHVTEAKANEALCIAHGFEPGPLAPAAPGAVGVDEATLTRWRSLIDHAPSEVQAEITAALAGKDASHDR